MIAYRGKNGNILFLLLLVSVLATIIYLELPKAEEHFTICVFKNVTGISCPSCGMGRGLISIFDGNFQAAMHYQPFSFLAAIGIIVSIPWLAYDVIKGHNTYQTFFREKWVKRILILIAAALFIRWFYLLSLSF